MNKTCKIHGELTANEIYIKGENRIECRKCWAIYNKRAWQKRVERIKNGIITPLVCKIHGQIPRERMTYDGRCKDCKNKRQRVMYHKNPEKFREKDKIYSENNKLKRSERRKRYYQNNMEKEALAGIKDRKELKSYYVRAKLKEKGFMIEDITPELIDFKRSSMKLNRLIKERRIHAKAKNNTRY